MILKLEEYHALLRRDFYSFIQRCFHQLNPSTPFLPNGHIELIAAKLEACRKGTIRRLIINLPPRNLKSLCASIALPAWCLGQDPTAQILCVSYAQELSDKLARDCRSIVGTDWYRKLFPTRLSPQKQSVQEFVTTAQGFRLATSVGGVLTGRGADLIVIDDPLKPDEALSDVQRRAANEWYENTLYSRLNDKNLGCIIIIMQRLHEDDLVGHVLGQENWEVVCLPAIAERDEVHVIETPCGPRRFTRKAGEALHPTRESLVTLQHIRHTLGEYSFAGQYLQAPAPLGGGMVKVDWFNRFDTDATPKFERIVQSWDTANKATELSSYSVCTTWGVVGKKAYLLHVLRRRMEYPELKRAVREQMPMFEASVVLIENKASGMQLLQELIHEGAHGVTAYEPEGDKIMRMHAQTAMIENGFVYLPKKAPWLTEYLHELSTFPNSKHKDQVDSTSQFLDWFKRASQEPAMLTFVRMQLAERLHVEGKPDDEIARKVESTPEEVKAWREEQKNAGQELLDIYNRTSAGLNGDWE
jgi:predicted phage terminase large subunit-like protein